MYDIKRTPMRRSSLWAAFAALSVSCLTAQQPRVAVYMDFEKIPGTAAVSAMERETERLLKPSGIALDWRLTRENHGDHPVPALVVFRFKGSCKVDRSPGTGGTFRSAGESQTLASTQVSRGRVLPFSEVRCDQVRDALHFLHGNAGLKERQAALGRALGRVVAHELYHIFAMTTAHGKRGLARPSQTLEDLVSIDGPRFAQEDSRAMTPPTDATR
jgi:hypothetical protein